MTNIAKYKQVCFIWRFEQHTATDVFVAPNLNVFYISMTLLILFKTCNLQVTLSQLIPKSYPLDLWVIHFLPHALYKELNHHLTLSQMIPKSCPTGSLGDSLLDTLRTQFIMRL